MDIYAYRTLIFDCDGVVMHSNPVKSQAYFTTAKVLGASDEQAQSLVDYHVKLGGISRYHKFDYYLREIVRQPVTDQALTTLLNTFAQQLELGLLSCQLADGLDSLRAMTKSRWLIVSGGDQVELNWLFAKRGIKAWFDGGIFGSPDHKIGILRREHMQGHLQHPMLFIGDSEYDYIAAQDARVDFVFLSGWTDMPNWQQFCQKNNITVRVNVRSLMRHSE